MTGVNFEGVARRKIEILGSYGKYVRTDIAKLYSSIYTHAIPWAIVGKDYVKKNHNTNAFKQSFANRLDKAVAAGQEGQTMGVPIGPDTSRILSELIAVEIEEITRKHIPDLDDRAVRYVDDIMIGLKNSETAYALLAGLSSAMQDYELELNPEKRFTYGVGHQHSPDWMNFIRKFKLAERLSAQEGDLNSYFEQALYLAKFEVQGRRYSVCNKASCKASDRSW